MRDDRGPDQEEPDREKPAGGRLRSAGADHGQAIGMQMAFRGGTHLLASDRSHDVGIALEEVEAEAEAAGPDRVGGLASRRGS